MDWSATRLNTPGKRTAALLLLAAVCLLGGGTALKSDYLTPRKVLTDGRPGVFHLDRCEQRKHSESRRTTFCHGSFRATDGSLVLQQQGLKEDYDADEIRPGDSVRAHALREGEFGPARIVRSDETGRSNLRMRGLSALGMVLLGCTLAGFAARVRMAPGRARRTLGTWLGLAAVVSATLWALTGFSGLALTG